MKNAKAELTVQEYSELLSIGPAVIYTAEVSGSYRATFISENVKQQMGYEPEDFLSDPDFWAERIHPEDKPQVFDELSKLSETGRPIHEYLFLRKDGTYCWMHDEHKSVHDADGNPEKIIGYWVDITDRKLAEEALRKARDELETRVEERTLQLLENEERFQEFIKIGSDWLWEMDADLRYSYFSPSYKEHSGVPIQDAIGRTREELYAEVLPNLDNGDIEQWDKFNQLVKTRKTFRDCGTKWVGSNGQIQYFSTSGKPIFGQGGKFLGYRGVGTNITESKLADEEREFLISELETKNTELERFVYTISHELKSPLVTIAGFTGILLDDLNGGDNKKLENHVQRITTAVGTMSVMLDDLLELSRIGRIIHTTEAVALVDLAHEVVNSIKSQAVELDITVEIASDLPVVCGDRARLREALKNMIENAIKFCDSQSKPHVKIGSRKQVKETVCYVQDNGKGIDPKYHGKVFGLFERLDPTVKGTGIGLTLVHRILEEHGGRVWVESEGVGKGSCFCFTIPPHEDH
jgi:PAS domain S-box-containing protein